MRWNPVSASGGRGVGRISRGKKVSEVQEKVKDGPLKELMIRLIKVNSSDRETFITSEVEGKKDLAGGNQHQEHFQWKTSGPASKCPVEEDFPQNAFNLRFHWAFLSRNLKIATFFFHTTQSKWPFRYLYVQKQPMGAVPGERLQGASIKRCFFLMSPIILHHCISLDFFLKLGSF